MSPSSPFHWRALSLNSFGVFSEMTCFLEKRVSCHVFFPIATFHECGKVNCKDDDIPIVNPVYDLMG